MISRLHQVECRILELKGQLNDVGREQRISGNRVRFIGEARLAEANKPLLNELKMLETEHKFLIDGRDNLLWRVIWNIGVPVFVTILTMFISLKLGLVSMA